MKIRAESGTLSAPWRALNGPRQLWYLILRGPCGSIDLWGPLKNGATTQHTAAKCLRVGRPRVLKLSDTPK